MSAAQRGVALVTGGGKRIGRAIALRLAQDGYAVAVHASRRSMPHAQDVCGEIVATGGRASALVADLSIHDEVEALVPAARAALGDVTLIVNNASLFLPDAAAPFDGALFERHMAINLRAPLQLAAHLRAALPADARGCIVNVLDQRVARLTPHYFTYTLSKSALNTATQTLAQAFAPWVRVNSVAPGPVLANENDGPEAFGKEAAATPLGESVEPAEIAEAVAYLAAARSVTGQTIFVDAGQHVAWRTPDVIAGYE